jgi:hypothetical protein
MSTHGREPDGIWHAKQAAWWKQKAKTATWLSLDGKIEPSHRNNLSLSTAFLAGPWALGSGSHVPCSSLCGGIG